MVSLPAAAESPPSRGRLLVALAAAFAAASAYTLILVGRQLPGADFSCFWAGARTALAHPDRLYDFAYVSGLQGWPLGPGKLRPFIYPPSALFLFLPFAWPAYWPAYAAFVLSTLGLMAWAARRAGLPAWFVLLPPVAYVAFCGQVTFLAGGLALGGLALRRRPGLAGVLLGLGAALKPQLFLLVPLALAADRQWRTMLVAGLTGAGLSAAAAVVWGPAIWLDWLAALGRFNTVVYQGDPDLVADALTPYAVLKAHGLPAAVAYLLAPAVLLIVWRVFRRSADPADRSLALLGGALAISPYAMNYEAALLAPAVAAYLARTRDARWLGYAGLASVYAVALGPFPFACLAAAVALPLVRTLGRPDYSAA